MCKAFSKGTPGYRRTLHSYLRHTLRALGAPEDAIRGFPHLKPVRPRETTTPDIEFEAVYRAAGPMLQLCLLLAREAGLRHATILTVSAANCNFESGTINGRSKAYSSYTVPMTNRLRQKLLWACAGASDPTETLLCQYNRQRKAPHYNSLTCALSRAKKLAPIPIGTWGFHDLRRTAARKLYDATHDIRKVQAFLGHAAPQQTWWYMGNAAAGLTTDEMEQASSEATSEKRKGAA